MKLRMNLRALALTSFASIALKIVSACTDASS
jgi:hypothetical protein